MFVKDIDDKRQFSKIHKELLKFNNKETDNLIKKWAKEMLHILYCEENEN